MKEWVNELCQREADGALRVNKLINIGSGLTLIDLLREESPTLRAWIESKEVIEVA